jgi:L-asparaginase/Glu-tRNA(Gln) amidotransferase subunit D
VSSLFLMITITDRRSTDGFLQLYKSHGVTVSMRTVGSGTAVQETLSTLGLEKTEKAVLLAVVTAESWQKIRKMQIDVPGTGIAFIVPLSSIGGKRALMFLTEHQSLTWKEESTLKDTRYELLLVVANQGYTGSIMDAARTAGAGGGTVIHAKGTGMEGAAAFLGVELVNEKELVLIVSRTSQKNTIMKAIMEGANPKAGTIVFSLPVTDTAGLRLMEEDEAQPEAAL